MLGKQKSCAKCCSLVPDGRYGASNGVCSVVGQWQFYFSDLYVVFRFECGVYIYCVLIDLVIV